MRRRGRGRPHVLDCSYPVENGIVKDWDDMELLKTAVL